MLRVIVNRMLVALLLTCVSSAVFRSASTSESRIITVKADGSIDPVGAPIERINDDLYILTEDITSIADGIVIERDNMTLDGRHHSLRGPGTTSSVGILLSGRTNVTIKNLEIKQFNYGLELDSSFGIEISGNLVDLNCGDGIFLNSASHNNVTGNVVTANSADGIFLYLDSNHNFISRNVVKGNNYRGIDLFFGCNNNTISENNLILNNRTGLYLSASSDNSIYHNNFIDNKVQVETFESHNALNNGYPSGGNYWQGYNSPDNFGGPYQNQTGQDGIIDMPYIIDAKNRDNYPLTKPWNPSPQISGDINGDGIVDILDAVTLANSFLAIPDNPYWNPNADLNNDSLVDILDAIILANHFNEHNP